MLEDAFPEVDEGVACELEFRRIREQRVGKLTVVDDRVDEELCLAAVVKCGEE